MRTGSYIFGAIVAGVLLLTGSAGAARSVEPLPVLSGVPLSGLTHLRLIVSGAPPYILDLDSGAIRPVAGVTDTHTDGVWVMPVRGGALAATYRYCKGCNVQMSASIVGADGSVRRVASGRSVVASRNSAAAWVLNRDWHGPLHDPARARPWRCRRNVVWNARRRQRCRPAAVDERRNAARGSPQRASPRAASG